ncbi:hypothetical protein DFQ30_011127 [Apophysomyces sp. BC1015]|nr:hypothetical protein DFQ30_011127 [Apophysomyces sp. BC1015]
MPMLAADQRDRIERTLVRRVPAHHEPHRQAHEGAEQHDHELDRHVEPDEHRVQAQHHEHRQVLVEVLHRNRMPRGQQHVPAAADDDQESIRAYQVGGHVHTADVQCPVRWKQLARAERHHYHQQSHHDAHRQHRQRALERHLGGREHRAAGHAERDHCLQYRAFGQRHAQRHFGPFEHDELQRGAGAPEQRGDGQRNLAELVAPQCAEALGKVPDQLDRPVLLRRIAHAGVRDPQVEQRGERVHGHDHDYRGLRRGMDERRMIEQRLRNVRADQRAAHHGAQDDRCDGRTLDPAVGRDQALRRQQFGQDPVFGRRVRGCAKADDAVGEQRMRTGQHDHAAEHLDRVGDEHDAAFRARVRICTNKGSKYNIRQDKEQLQQRRHPVRRVKVFQQSYRSDQKRTVGERRKELRCHDGVKTFLHLMLSLFPLSAAATGLTRSTSHSKWIQTGARPDDSDRVGDRVLKSLIRSDIKSPLSMPRPLLATIHTAALANNLAVARRYAPKSKIWAVVKADAYGHGLARAFPGLRSTDGFGLLDLEEAVKLRELGWAGPILLLEGFFRPTDIDVIDRYSLTTTVHCDEQLRMLKMARLSKPVNIQLKMNTGMNRLGYVPGKYRAAWERARACPGIGQITLMTHFSDADGEIGIRHQLEAFEHGAEGIAGARSLSNSAATLWHRQAHFDWVRPGIMLYGASPSGVSAAIDGIGLQPTMTLSSELIAVQTVELGGIVGYGSAFKVRERMRVGVVACGYADGYPRCAPERTPIRVNGVPTRVVGRVSMDMLTVDLTPCPNAGVGSRVELWGPGVPIDDVAAACGTVGYELMCAIAKRVLVRAE